MNTDREQRIRELAHRIWESEGRPHGEEQRHWQMAVRLVEAGEPKPPSTESTASEQAPVNPPVKRSKTSGKAGKPPKPAG